MDSISSEIERLAKNFQVDEPMEVDDNQLIDLRRRHKIVLARLEADDAACFLGKSGANIDGVSLDLRLEGIERKECQWLSIESRRALAAA